MDAYEVSAALDDPDTFLGVETVAVVMPDGTHREVTGVDAATSSDGKTLVGLELGDVIP